MTISHLLQIAVFALAFWLRRDKFGLGGFGGTFQDSLSSFLYFSSETYTTLGFGDIYMTLWPSRTLRQSRSHGSQALCSLYDSHDRYGRSPVSRGHGI